MKREDRDLAAGSNVTWLTAHVPSSPSQSSGATGQNLQRDATQGKFYATFPYTFSFVAKLKISQLITCRSLPLSKSDMKSLQMLKRQVSTLQHSLNESVLTSRLIFPN